MAAAKRLQKKLRIGDGTIDRAAGAMLLKRADCRLERIERGHGDDRSPAVVLAKRRGIDCGGVGIEQEQLGALRLQQRHGLSKVCCHH